MYHLAGDKYDIRPHMLGASAAIVGVAQAQLTKCIVAKTANLPITEHHAGVVSPDCDCDRKALTCVHGRKRLLHLFGVVSDVISMAQTKLPGIVVAPADDAPFVRQNTRMSPSCLDISDL